MIDEHGWVVWPAQPAPPLDREEPTKTAAPVDMSLPGVVSRVVEWTKEATAPKSSVRPDALWRDPSASPAVLLLMFLDKYGDEALEWAPDTVKLTLERSGLKPSNSSFTKLLAAMSVMMTPSPWRQWEVFHHICRALAGEPPNFVYLEYPELGHLIAGYDLMHTLDPNRETDYEVDKYIAAAFRSAGVVYLPPPLDFAQAELEEARLECLECGAVHRDDNDVKCVSCGASALVKLPYEYQEMRDELELLWRKTRGLSLEKAIEYPVSAELEHARQTLLIHGDYAAEQRRNTAMQLRSIA